MPTVNVYLTFAGNCEEAFNYYRHVFGAEFENVNRYKEMPPQEGMPPIPDEFGEKIMHVSLPISSETRIMGSDQGGDWVPDLRHGNNFAISVNSNDVEEGRRIFESLADGGKVTMPFEKTFWQAYFGMATDKFSINWMVNCNLPEHKSNQ